MNKLLLLLVALLALTCTSEVLEDSPVMVGGYSSLNWHDLQDQQDVMEIVDFARQEYAQQNGGELGPLVKIDRQLVAGFNYKMVFESEQGNV